VKPPPWLIAGALIVFSTARLRADTGEMPPDPPVSSPHVRAVTPAVQTLLNDAVARSAVINGLIRRLAQSDTFVYVEMTASPEIPTACTKLVAGGAGARFVRITLNTLLSRWDQLPLLGHELQHAMEIAEAVDVRDDADVRRHFARVGFSIGIDHYETQAARDIEHRVRVEIARPAKSARF
jgi:hypothetical protein